MLSLISKTRSINIKNFTKFRFIRLNASTITNKPNNEEEPTKIKVAGSNYFQEIVKSAATSNKKLEDLDINIEKIKYDEVEKYQVDHDNLADQNESHLFARKFLKQAKKQRVMSNLNKGHSKLNHVEENKEIFPDVEITSSSRDLIKEAYDVKNESEPDNTRRSFRSNKTENFQIRKVKDDYYSKNHSKQMYREYISKYNDSKTDLEKKIDFYDSENPKKYLNKNKKKEYEPIKYEQPSDQISPVIKKDYGLRQYGKNLSPAIDDKGLAKIDQEKNQDLEEYDEEDSLEKDSHRFNKMSFKRPVVYNLAYFVNSNPLLQKLVEMGVQIRQWDKNREICEFILRIDMEKLQTGLIFLHDLGLSLEDQRFILNKNPLFLKENIIDLNNRINYLKSKKFDDESIRVIISKAPKWLSMSVNEIDSRLGWYQKEFSLTANELRLIVSEKPKLVVLPLKIPSDVRFCLKEILCYPNETIKQFIIRYPKLFTKQFKIIEANFIFLTQVMKLTHDQIALYPPILQCPLILIKSRYTYLKHLNLLQFDPTLPNFVSLKALCDPFDSNFCKNTSKTSLQDYKNFLKSI